MISVAGNIAVPISLIVTLFFSSFALIKSRNNTKIIGDVRDGQHDCQSCLVELGQEAVKHTVLLEQLVAIGRKK